MNMAEPHENILGDSLNAETNELQGTYRVEGVPQPQPVSNEEEFITNSGRRIKKSDLKNKNENSYNNKRLKNKVGENAAKHFEMTESIQAELHLSLDRLSENSFDPESNKNKNNNPSHPTVSSKSYPLIPSTNYQQNNLKFNKPSFIVANESSNSPTISNQSSNSTTTNNSTMRDTTTTLIPSGRQPSSSNSTVKDSLELRSNQSVPRVTDSLDDIHTVVADDFMVSDRDDDSLTNGYTEMKKIDKKSTNPTTTNDPYAHLRYNPDWRENNVSPEMVIDFREAPRLPKTPVDAEQSPTKSKKGAIIVHNPDLSPINDHNKTDIEQNGDVIMIDRESMLRLSSDPNKMLKVNAQYENEFEKMMEMERKKMESEQHKEENYGSSPHESSNTSNSQYRSRIPKPRTYHKSLVPKTESQFSTNTYIINQDQHYLDPHQESNYNSSPRNNFENEDKVNYEDKYSPGRTKEKKRINPAPPEAPKSNRDRDYIELNKLRLGRKSNSASYLEMYSKRNKKEKNSPKQQERRPKSDSNKNKSSNSQPNVMNENEVNNNETLEDRWSQQADRLKSLTSGKPPLPRKPKQRETLREVGNQVRPQYNVNDVTNYNQNMDQQQSPPLVSPRRQFHHQSQTGSSESRQTSKHRYSYESEDSNFSDHPAFATFSEKNEPHFVPDSYRGDGFDKPYQNEDKLIPRQTQQHFASREYQNAYQGSGKPRNGSNIGDSPFYQVKNEDFEKQSPLMQAYNQKFVQRQPIQQQQFYNQQNFSPRQQQHFQNQQNYSPQHQQFYSQQNYPNQQNYSPQHQQNFQNQQNHSPQHQQPHSQQNYPNQHQQNYQQQDKMSLPPSQGPVRSPRKVEYNYQENMNNNVRGRAYSDSYGYNNNYNNGSQDDKKHVNFAPAYYPDQPYSKPLYKYPLPLPPTPPAPLNRGQHDRISPRGDFHSDGDVQVVPGLNRNQNIPVLPPINPKSQNLNSSHDSSMFGKSFHAETDGYLHQYEKQKKKKNYKKYTLSDYKNLKRDINLGGLGPDLITAKQKMDKIERSRKYAEYIRQQHKSNKKTYFTDDSGVDVSLESNDKRFSMGTESEQKLQEVKDRRQKALDYAKQVPKPKPQPLYTSSPTLNPPSNHTTPRPFDPSPNGENPSNDEFDWELLQAMRERHEREKVLVAELSSSRIA